MKIKDLFKKKDSKCCNIKVVNLDDKKNENQKDKK